MASVTRARSGLAFLTAFGVVAVGVGAGRAITTTYLPVLLERIKDARELIGAVMLVNAIAGFFVPLAAGWWSDRRGTRAPFILGGAIVAAGGLILIAMGVLLATDELTRLNVEAQQWMTELGLDFWSDV